METVKRLFGWLRRWEYSGLCLLVLVVLVWHFSIIMQPNEPLFDEQHYVPDARVIINGGGTERPEHPPLGKLLIVAGIKLFGDNPIGWRLFSVIFSVAGIIFFYLICRRLNLSPRVAYLATFLLALENLSFVQGSIAMLDVFSLTLALAAFWLYLKDRYVMSGVAVALSVLAKMSGALAILVIGLHWLLAGWRRPRRFLPSMLAAPITFLALMPLLDFAIWQKWLNPVAQIQNMLSLSSSLIYNGISLDTGSRPWEWVLFPEIMPYWWTPRYLGMISPTLWVFIIPIVVYITYRAIKGNTQVLLSFSWFVGGYLVWIPVGLIIKRVTYIFYVYPIIGAISIGLGIVLFQLLDIAKARHRGKLRWFIALVVPLYLLIHTYTFIIIAPFSIGQTAPPYIGISITPESIWWSIPMGLVLYIFTLRFLGIVKWRRFGDSLALAENKVAKPAEQ